ncbi:MAG: elongation factor P hydroxylase [Legionellaceae bacterium]|nr:elongation factor P hydroxylase [Legionellaceae bacterium]
MHQPDDLIRIFNDCFKQTYHTVLARGDDEPIYLPADEHRLHHTIYFAHGFFSSALHECAHWLIAGKERRRQEDYGYWYVPDGRNAEQQNVFQSVEVKPQAMEWILSHSANYPFQFSIDNLNGEPSDMEQFKAAVYQQVLRYQHEGLPLRATIFRNSLVAYYPSASSTLNLRMDR